MSAILDRATWVFVGCCALALMGYPTAEACAQGESSSDETLLLQLLNHRVSVDFLNEPIRAALDTLSGMASTEEKITLAFDQRSLAEAAVSLDAKMTLRAKNIPLRSALDFVLGQGGAAWTIKDGMLTITTRKVADSHLLTLNHRVTGLAFREEAAGHTANFRQLIAVIQREIAPDSWDKRGGPGTIDLFAQNGFTLNRCNLIVRQTAANHCEIARLLAELRENPPLTEAEKKIRKALEDTTVLEFVETPLNDVVSYLKDLHQVEIQIDSRALKDASVNLDQPITKTLRGVSLRQALRQILDPLDLTFVIKDDVLLITPKEKDGKPVAEVPPDCGQTPAADKPPAPAAAPPSATGKDAKAAERKSPPAPNPPTGK